MNARAAILLVALAGCSPPGEPAPRRACELRIWHRPSPSIARLEVVGSWDDWQAPRTLERREDGWWLARLPLEPGGYQYLLSADGRKMLDPERDTSGFHDGKEVSVAEVEDCRATSLRVESAFADEAGVLVTLVFWQSADGATLVPSSVAMTLDDGSSPSFERTSWDPETGRLELRVKGLAAGKHRLHLEARDSRGKPALGAIATAWVDAPTDLRDLVVYQVMVDRFLGADGEALPAPPTPGARAGGHLDGVRRALESGFFERLGVNALWLSPLYQATDEVFGPEGRRASGYHGYWPVQPRTIDPRLGGEAALDALVSAAHARGVRVLFDVVPNHVERQHPYATRSDWLTAPCTCGSAECPWSTHIQTCWFDSFLPDLDWKRPEVAQQLTADVAWWFERFSADGVRIDAVPMMPRAATRGIAAAVRERFDHAGNRSYLLGENFTGADGWSRLRADLGPAGLDGEFHFPLLWALRSSIAEGSSPLSDVDEAVQRGELEWEGADAVMGLTIGNHDMPRFASVAAGGLQDGWQSAPQPEDAGVYARQRLALGLTFVLPGAPVVYQGDELGLAGFGDPDSRRVLPAGSAISEGMAQTRSFVEQISRVRREQAALRRGGYQSLLADAERLAFVREVPGEAWALVVAQRRPSAPGELQVPPGDYLELMSGEPFHAADGHLTVAPDPFSLRVFVPNPSKSSVPLR